MIVTVNGVQQLQVNDGTLIDYENDPDHAYQIVINSYTDVPTGDPVADAAGPANHQHGLAAEIELVHRLSVP